MILNEMKGPSPGSAARSRQGTIRNTLSGRQRASLGVRYVLEGSVRRAGNRVRINAQLIDAATGFHLSAQRYDRDLEDIFALQDEITRAIVAALEAT
jgi:TolB-like protein